eukprot:s130_g2.t1
MCSSAVLSACSTDGAPWNKMLRWLFEMQEQDVKHSAASFTAVISACRWLDACAAFWYMGRCQLQRDSLSFGSAAAVVELSQGGEGSVPNLLHAPVDRIRRHLAAVERRLEGIAATELQQRSMREVSVNCNVSMGGSWETKRVVLTVEGFTLVDRNGQEGTELTPWSEVSSPGPEPSEPSMVETPTGPLRRITQWWRGSSEAGDGARSNLYQAEMQLPNRRITLQFGAAGPPELMQRLWQASQGNRDAAGPGGKVQPLLDLLGKCLQGEMHGLEIITIYQEPLLLPGLNFCQVRQQLSRNGSSNPIQRMHEATKAERIVSWDWNQDVLTPGQVKFFEFKQILPGGLGPSETRVSAVYHLEPDDPNQVILHKATKPWDVPFKDDFLVYHKHIFAKVLLASVAMLFGYVWLVPCSRWISLPPNRAWSFMDRQSAETGAFQSHHPEQHVSRNHWKWPGTVELPAGSLGGLTLISGKLPSQLVVALYTF